MPTLHEKATVYRLRVEARLVDAKPDDPAIELTVDVPADDLGAAQIKAHAMVRVLGYEIEAFRSQMPASMADENILTIAARLITGAIANHDEGLAAVIDSKHLVRQIVPLFWGFPSREERAPLATPGAGRTLTADFEQLRNDLYWKVWAGEDGRISWTGYDDANWWDNVSKSAAARTRVGKSTGQIYRLDHKTGVVEILAPKTEG